MSLIYLYLFYFSYCFTFVAARCGYGAAGRKLMVKLDVAVVAVAARIPVEMNAIIVMRNA